MKPKILFIFITLIFLRVFPTVLFEDFSSPYFPPAGWAVYNQDGGNQVWHRSPAKSRSAPACARSRFEGPHQRNDDWLVTKRLFPYPGADTLKFWYRAHECNFPESLEVLLSLTGNQPKDFSIRLDAFGFTSEEYQLRIIPLSGYHYTPIYIAFRNVGIFGVNSCYLDDISGVGEMIKDVGVVSILYPREIEEPEQEIYPTVLIKNFGSAVVNFSVELVIGKSPQRPVVVYRDTFLVNGMNPGDTLSILFSEPWFTVSGEYDVTARTLLLDDENPDNDQKEKKTLVSEERWVDVGVSAISPFGVVPPGEQIPVVGIANYGNTDESLMVFVEIRKESLLVYQDSLPTFLLAQKTAELSFPGIYLDTGDYHIIAYIPPSVDDRDTTNNRKAENFECWCEVPKARDIALREIISPRGEYLEGTLLRPSVLVENKGNFIETFTTYFLIPPYYTKAITVFGLLPNEERQINFLSLLLPAGDYEAQSFISSPFPQEQSNDSLTRSFVVRLPQPPPEYPWVLLSPLPFGQAKPSLVKAGGALTTAGKFCFALKGGNSNDFSAYNLRTKRWEERKPLPVKKKGVKGGGALTSDGLNWIYCIKGNNTLEFYKYEVKQDSWQQLKDVPAGEKKKKIKDGAGIVFVKQPPQKGYASDDTCFIFLAKGGGTREFYVYSVARDSWQKRNDIPLGPSKKGLKKGSALVNYNNQYIYLLKGGVPEFYCYDIVADTWMTKNPMPLYRSGSMKKTKTGAGAALAWDGAKQIYAFKGQGQEYWAYFVTSDSWVEKETLPRLPNDKKLGDGGALTFAEGKVYALKGNRTLEFWQYTPNVTPFTLGFGSADNISPSNFSPLIKPNPTKDQVYIYCNLPTKAEVYLRVYDIFGRLVYSEKTNKGKFVLKKFPTGIYLLHLEVGNNKINRKLIIVK